MAAINPYLNFMGNTEEAFDFYRSVFGGEFVIFQRFKDIPGAERMPEEDQEKVMHVSLPIGQGSILMGTDALASMGHTLTAGNNFYISISAQSEAEAETLFHGLAAGGQVTVPLDKAFWGSYFGMFIDKFGIQWMINYEYDQQL